MLLDASNLELPTVALFFSFGVVAWTFAEYLTHRFVLHAIAPSEHRAHHAYPQDYIDKSLWQIWLAFALVYLICRMQIKGTAMLFSRQRFMTLPGGRAPRYDW